MSFQQLFNYFHCWHIDLMSKCFHTIKISAAAVESGTDLNIALCCVVSCWDAGQWTRVKAVPVQKNKLPEAGQAHAFAKPPTQKGLLVW